MRAGIGTVARAIGAAALLAAIPAAASAKTTWQVQTSSTAGDPFFQHYLEWLPKLTEMTNGELSIELLPNGSVVPFNESMDAVAGNIIQGDLTLSVYFAGRDKAFALLGDLIAGYDTPFQATMFCYYGGGKELLQEAFDQYAGGQVVAVGCASAGREALVSAVPIETVEQLKGVKIRAPEGLAADVFRRAGAAPVTLPSAEVFTAVERGIVEAADLGPYAFNRSSGMHEIAKYPIFPGIHSMPQIQFSVNRGAWEALTPGQRTAVDVWYRAMLTELNFKNEMTDREAVAADLANTAGGVRVINWPLEERAKFRAFAAEAWAEFAKASPLAQKAYDANIAYMKKLGLLEE